MTQLNRLLGLALASLVVGLAVGQDDAEQKVDPAAAKAFEKLVTSMRERPGVTVKTTLKISVSDGTSTSDSKEVKAEFTRARGGTGVLRLNGFTCFVKDGTFDAIHESTKDKAYFEEKFEGSPYWVFLDAFREMPFPHLGLLWGDEAMTDVYMELHPRTAEIVPASVSEQVIDGKAMQTIVLSSAEAAMRINVDPKTQLIQTIEHEITSGPFVRQGSKLTSRYAFEYEMFDPAAEGAAAALTFDRGQRQRVDMVAALVDAPPPADQPGFGAPGAGPGGPALVGKPAPPFVLATADGGAIDLADLRGQVVVLDFWATWCGPCRQALPLLHEVGKWVADGNLPVRIITVNTYEIQDPSKDTPDARLKKVKDFWTKSGFTLPVAMDYSNQTALAYQARGIPTTVVIRSDGVVHAYHVGGSEEYAAELKADIQDAIKALEKPE